MFYLSYFEHYIQYDQVSTEGDVSLKLKLCIYTVKPIDVFKNVI